MNGGKRVGRPTRLSTVTPAGMNLPDIKLTDGPVPPKHIPYPYIPQDGTLLFETMTFVFTLIAAGLQFLNLYRTVWWLPHSYTNQAMVRYLIFLMWCFLFFIYLLILCSPKSALK